MRNNTIHITIALLLKNKQKKQYIRQGGTTSWGNNYFAPRQIKINLFKYKKLLWYLTVCLCKMCFL